MDKNKYKIKVPKSSAFNIETPLHLPKMHFVGLSIGKRGSGKTVAIVNYLKYLQDAGCLDRLFIISPSVHSNKHIFDMVKYDDDDVYEEPTKMSMDSVISKIKEEARDYEEYLEKIKQYKKLQKYLKRENNYIHDDDLISLYGDGEFEKPKHRHNGKKPIMLILFDDCQGSDIYKPKCSLYNHVIKHRHLGQFKEMAGALGVSMIFAVQSYKSIGGGLPRGIRSQATWIMLFKTKDAKELDEIAEECNGEVTREIFLSAYEEATEGEHNFLFIDFHPKEKYMMFRKNFDRYIDIKTLTAGVEPATSDR
jgi:hypothetical protein